MQDQFNPSDNTAFELASVAMEVGTNIGGVRNSTQSIVSSAPISNQHGVSDHDFRNSFSGYAFNNYFISFCLYLESLLCRTKFKESLWQDLGLLKVRISYHHSVMQLNTCLDRQEIKHLTKTRTFMGTTLDSRDMDISILT